MQLSCFFITIFLDVFTLPDSQKISMLKLSILQSLSLKLQFSLPVVYLYTLALFSAFPSPVCSLSQCFHLCSIVTGTHSNISPGQFRQNALCICIFSLIFLFPYAHSPVLSPWVCTRTNLWVWGFHQNALCIHIYTLCLSLHTRFLIFSHGHLRYGLPNIDVVCRSCSFSRSLLR